MNIVFLIKDDKDLVVASYSDYKDCIPRIGETVFFKILYNFFKTYSVL